MREFALRGSLPPGLDMPSSTSTPGTMSPQECLFACYQQALGHDLPNKFVALQGLARLLDQELAGQLSGEAREWLDRILGLTKEVDSQVRALAEVGRVFRQTDPAAPVNLEELWSELSAVIAFQMRDRVLSFAHSPALPVVTLPPRALRRVLVELLHSAVHRSPPGTPLRITLTAVSARLLTLHDDGPTPGTGFSQQAFEPRLDGPGGPALGLFLARLLVEGWGGSIHLDSPPEGGCLVTLEVTPSRSLDRGDVRMDRP